MAVGVFIYVYIDLSGGLHLFSVLSCFSVDPDCEDMLNRELGNMMSEHLEATNIIIK